MQIYVNKIATSKKQKQQQQQNVKVKNRTL